MATSKWSKRYWVKETFSGGSEFRTRSKVLLAILPFVLSWLLYWLLIVIEDLPSGPGIIIALAYGVIALMATLMLLAIILSIVDYLHRFE